MVPLSLHRRCDEEVAGRSDDWDCRKRQGSKAGAQEDEGKRSGGISLRSSDCLYSANGLAYPVYSTSTRASISLAMTGSRQTRERAFGTRGGQRSRESWVHNAQRRASALIRQSSPVREQERPA